MQFDMSRAWDDTRAMLSGNSSMITVVAGVFFFLPYFVLMLMTPDAAQNPALQPGSASDPDAVVAAMMAVYSQIWWLMILLIIMQGVGTLALYALLRHRERPTVGEAISFGFKGLLPYVGAAILQGLIFMLGIGIPLGLAFVTGSSVVIGLAMILAFVAALYLYTKFSLTVPVIGLEREFNPVNAIRRSWSLTKGNSLRIFLFYFLLILAFMVVSLVIGMVFGVIFALMGPSAALLGNGLISSLVNAVFVCGFLAVLAAVHQQLAGRSPQTISETFD